MYYYLNVLIFIVARNPHFYCQTHVQVHLHQYQHCLSRCHDLVESLLWCPIHDHLADVTDAASRFMFVEVGTVEQETASDIAKQLETKFQILNEELEKLLMGCLSIFPIVANISFTSRRYFHPILLASVSFKGWVHTFSTLLPSSLLIIASPVVTSRVLWFMIVDKTLLCSRTFFLVSSPHNLRPLSEHVTNVFNVIFLNYVHVVVFYIVVVPCPSYASYDSIWKWRGTLEKPCPSFQVRPRSSFNNVASCQACLSTICKSHPFLGCASWSFCSMSKASGDEQSG